MVLGPPSQGSVFCFLARGRQRAHPVSALLSCLQLKILLTSAQHILGWHTLNSSTLYLAMNALGHMATLLILGKTAHLSKVAAQFDVPTWSDHILPNTSLVIAIL